MLRVICSFCVVLCLSVWVQSALAGEPFGLGWTLDVDASALNFQSVKNTKVVEESRFATFTGVIDPAGTARISVLP